jgi:hypothetical protein
MAIVNLYIDGFNLYYGALKRMPYKWLDLGKLAQALLPSDTIQALPPESVHGPTTRLRLMTKGCTSAL